ncbi:acyltransferase family protein [Reyranella sp. CPCC 100927]|uniref:acyltransferase family protein n=1 Tax=Reyranella sp. CPCC 100927 TaxID=2599616 RepID=UPI0011B84FEB|nr:acyltransferase family protein [Reyranella sp. CPCC 100927]TWT10088.1 acyltransferase family protein [Reyranella sp. CPCC 100927]
MIATSSADRRADIDWLRVGAFSLLILYHAGMAYTSWGWHVKDPQHALWLEAVMRFMNRWRMPLVFLVSGAAILLALGRRTPGAFVRDRLQRLLLPLAFGMLVIVPPQVYLERLQRGQFSGSFLEFLPQALTGVYPAGNMSWHHLWFLAYVLILTLVLLPVFLWMRSPAGAATLDRLSQRVAAQGGLLWLLVLPPTAIQVWLAPLSSNRNGLVGDWVGLASAALLLLYGALLLRGPLLLDLMARQRWLALAVGIVSYAALYIAFFSNPAWPSPALASRLDHILLENINGLAWLFAITGFVTRHLRTRPAGLAYATEAVYPFYILHQTVTVIVAYHLASADLPVSLKFVLTAGATFLGTWLIYEGIVRRIDFLRPLFGLKIRGAARSRRPLATQAGS